LTKEQLKKLEANLWDSANTLRATGGIKSADYAVPVLGIIFLRFADNKYALSQKAIEEEYAKAKGTRAEVPLKEIAIKHCGLYLSETSRYDYLLNLPTDQSLAKAIKEAMEDIESHQDEQYQDILPTDAYAQIEKNSVEILPELIKTFSDIPATASGDVFGKIYEYFLGKFALSEGQKGGEFFTPTSVVKFIVESIEPYKGKIFDPACGSGGMFVQSANFIEKSHQNRQNIVVYGQEHERATVKLAKMNLLVNNLRGYIKKANSYEENPFASEGKFDFVMANPPFNVKGVKESTVKGDSRFNAYGLPKSKGKKDDKITDANYLWISLFATSLNKKGKAGFVMPNSASDARNSEYEIRKKIVDEGLVDCMVSIPSNMFYTVTLPATLWFFDKQKKDKDKILFIDARNVYTQIDRAHREWSDENIQNLSTIVSLYHGSREKYDTTIEQYGENLESVKEALEPCYRAYEAEYNELATVLEIAKLPKEVSFELESIEALVEMLKERNRVLQEMLKPKVRKLKLAPQSKALDEKLLDVEKLVQDMLYWDENIKWLTEKFPDGVYEDIAGLCKVADRSEYVDEQDYSLNAGRYVGIELEEDNLTADEFRALILEKNEALKRLNVEAHKLEALIDTHIGEVF